MSEAMPESVFRERLSAAIEMAQDWNKVKYGYLIKHHIERLEATIAQRDATIAAMREALRMFQERGHHPDCSWNPLEDENPSPCNCGYHRATIALSDTAAYALDCFAAIRADEHRKVLEEVRQIVDEVVSDDEEQDEISRRIEQLAAPPEEAGNG